MFARLGSWCFRRRWVVVIGSLLAVFILAGHAQFVVFSGMAWVIYGVFFTLWGEGTRQQRLGFGEVLLREKNVREGEMGVDIIGL